MKLKSIISSLVLGFVAVTLASCAKSVTSLSANIPTEMVLGETHQVEVKVLPEDADIQTYTLVSDNESVISVTDSTLKAEAIGLANLTLTSDDKTIDPINYTVNVVHSYPTDFQTNVPTEINLTEKPTLEVKLIPETATFKEYKVVSSNVEVLKYNEETKTLLPLKLGTSKLTISIPNTQVSKDYTINVVDLMPTDFEFTIPHEITTNDTIKLKPTFTPENATFTTYQVAVNDPDVLAYDGVEKTLTPLKPGKVIVSISIPEIGVYKDYPVLVRQGYTAPKSFDEFVTMIEKCNESWEKDASKIAIKKNAHAIYSDSEDKTIEDRTYKYADNSISFVIEKSHNSELETTYGLKSVEQDNYYELSYGKSNYDKIAYVKEIVKSQEEVIDSYIQITREDALKKLTYNPSEDFVDIITSSTFSSNLEADLFKTETHANGDYIVNATSTYMGSWSCNQTILKAKFNRYGQLLSATIDEARYGGETSDHEFGPLENSTKYEFSYLYGPKYAYEDLDYNDKSIYFATSYDVEYKAYNREINSLYVGDYLSTSNLKFKNVVPITASNLTNVKFTIKNNDDGACDDSGYNIKAVKPGTFKVRVEPIGNLDIPVMRDLIINVTYAKPTAIKNAKVDLRSNYLVIGEKSTLSASINPYNANQEYTVSIPNNEYATLEKDSKGVWTITAVKATPTNEPLKITFAAAQDPNISTVVSIDILATKPEIDTESPVGTWKGKCGGDFNKFDVTVIFKKDGNGTFSNKYGLIYNFTYTFNKANGNIEATCVLADPYSSFDDNKTYIWHFDNAKQKITGSITSDYGNINSEFTLAR